MHTIIMKTLSLVLKTDKKVNVYFSQKKNKINKQTKTTTNKQ